MSQPDDDVPPGVDFLSEPAARRWAEEAEAKLASRINFFAAFVQAITEHEPTIHRVLELGSGPGFLAEYILSRCVSIERYTLLDFSPTMLNLSAERLRTFGISVSYLRADFKQAGWTRHIDGPYDGIVTMQAVHELRHKRHAWGFYGACHAFSKRGGLLLVCDHLPHNGSERDRALFMTEEEHLAAIQNAGFSEVEILLRTTERLACRAIA
jgi:cyclopropane fatty-acyl-phospholipid synthase-like methyltransferase